jgi:hypothetical protein
MFERLLREPLMSVEGLGRWACNLGWLIALVSRLPLVKVCHQHQSTNAAFEGSTIVAWAVFGEGTRDRK